MILLNIVILQTRSVWVATVFFAFIFLLLWFIFTIKHKGVSKSISLKQVALIAASVIIIVSGSALIFKKTGTVELLKHKVSSLFDSKSHDNQGRFKMWESTLDLAEDNIFFGVGAGNWKISVLPYYNANFGSNYQNWRRPHNDFLWILSEKGIFALLFYVMIFIIIGIYGFKIILSETDRDKLFLTSLLIAGIGGYFIISMVTFPLERINHQIYLAIMMSGIISQYYLKPDNIKESSDHNKSSKIYFLVLIGVIVLSVASIYYSITLIRSEVNVQKLIAAKRAENWKSVIFYANNAITPVTTVDAYSMPIHLHRGVANVKLNNRKQAFKDFQIALGYFPTQISVLNNLAIVSAEMNNLDNSILYFNKALEIFPNYKVSAWNLVKAYYKKAEYENAYVALLNYSPDNTPDDYDRLKIDLIHRLNANTSLRN
jgi:tetratricopeptide (TPR) repeat protein